MVCYVSMGSAIEFLWSLSRKGEEEDLTSNQAYWFSMAYMHDYQQTQQVPLHHCFKVKIYLLVGLLHKHVGFKLIIDGVVLEEIQKIRLGVLNRDNKRVRNRMQGKLEQLQQLWV